MKHFFDIGGNSGQTLDWIQTLPSNYSDHIFWIFEPSPRHFAKLIEQCKKFSRQYRINLCPFGIGGRTAVVRLFEKDDPLGDSFYVDLSSDHKPANVSNGYDVFASVVSIDEMLRRFTALADEIVLDIDAEGSEYAILSRLCAHDDLLDRITQIFVEFHFTSAMKDGLSKETILRMCERHLITVTTRGSA